MSDLFELSNLGVSSLGLRRTGRRVLVLAADDPSGPPIARLAIEIEGADSEPDPPPPYRADVMVIGLDPDRGLASLALRQACVAALLRIPRVVVAVRAVPGLGIVEFERVLGAFRAMLQGLPEVHLAGVLVALPQSDDALPAWYREASLARYLVADGGTEKGEQEEAFRFQLSGMSAEGVFQGRVVAGRIAAGERFRMQPSGREGVLARIVGSGEELPEARKGMAVGLQPEGVWPPVQDGVVSAVDHPAQSADQFETTLVCLGGQPLLAGREYAFEAGGQKTAATVTEIKYERHLETGEHLAAKRLTFGAIATCNLGLGRAIAFDPFAEQKETGSFVLRDESSGETVALGLIHFALRRSQNIHMQHVDVDKAARAALKGQKPCVLWFTGLSGSGKSTIANLVEKRLHAMGRHTHLLDGDNVRHGLSKDLGFTDADRVENIRRIGEVCKLMVDGGLIVLTAFISPFRSERRMARSLVHEGEFIEVFVDTPLAIAEQRDPKGLYKKARRGDLRNFTGIDSPYEEPEHAEIRLDGARLCAHDAAEEVIRALVARGILSR